MKKKASFIFLHVITLFYLTLPENLNQSNGRVSVDSDPAAVAAETFIVCGASSSGSVGGELFGVQVSESESSLEAQHNITSCQPYRSGLRTASLRPGTCHEQWNALTQKTISLARLTYSAGLTTVLSEGKVVGFEKHGGKNSWNCQTVIEKKPIWKTRIKIWINTVSQIDIFCTKMMHWKYFFCDF